MNAKVFVFFLILVAVVVGVAFVTLFDDRTPEQVDGVPDTEQTTTSETPVRRPPTTVPDRVEPRGPGGEARPTRETAETAKVDFDPTGSLVITGKVTDLRTGEPIAEAEVVMVYPDGEEIDSTDSGADGTYRLVVDEGIPSKVRFRCWADEYAISAGEEMAVSRSVREMSVDFALRPWYRIEGQVVSALDGTPIEGVDVEVRSLSPLFEDEWDDAETNEAGFYVIEDIEDLPREGIDVWVESVDHAPMVKRNLTLPEGSDVLRVDFRLWETLTLRGVVVSAATREPIEDAEIAAASPDPEFLDDGEEELSDEDGSFEMELDSIPFEQIFVLVSAEEHGAVRIANVPPPDRNGVIDLGTIALPPGTVLTGYVVDAKTGAPVRGGDITIYAVGAPDGDAGDYADSELIESDGRFEIELEYAPPGTCEVVVEADDHFPLTTTIDIPAGIARHEIRLQVEPVVRLRGVVRRKVDGTPVAGARVRLLTSDESEDSLVGRAAADGTFVLDLPAGEASRFGVVVEYIDRRFPFGKLPDPRPGAIDLFQDFEVDLPPMRKPGR